MTDTLLLSTWAFERLNRNQLLAKITQSQQHLWNETMFQAKYRYFKLCASFFIQRKRANYLDFCMVMCLLQKAIHLQETQ